MAFVLADRVLETSTTAGTGTFTLAGAATGYQSFSAIGNANTTYYTIVHQTLSEWEVGIGTYTSAGTTLSRDTVLSSSASGAKVSFSAGTKNVFCDYPAYEANKPIDENFINITSNYSITSGKNGFSVGPVTIASGVNVTVPATQTWMILNAAAGSGGGTVATVGKAIAMALVFGG